MLLPSSETGAYHLNYIVGDFQYLISVMKCTLLKYYLNVYSSANSFSFSSSLPGWMQLFSCSVSKMNRPSMPFKIIMPKWRTTETQLKYPLY